MTDRTKIPAAQTGETPAETCPWDAPPCGEPVDPCAEYCDEHERENENAHYIVNTVGELADHVSEATLAVSHAVAALTDLMSDHVYDVEFADTSAGADARDELEEIARKLRHVKRIVAERDALLKEGKTDA